MESVKLILFLLTILNIVKGMEIRMTGFLYVAMPVNTELENRVNEYLKSKGSPHTFKFEWKDANDMVGDPKIIAQSLDKIIKKDPNDYDLYYTDTVYTGQFAEHFEDLNEWVKEDVIKEYKDGVAYNTCIVDNKLVALPFDVNYGGLYSNMDLLNKYNKTIPQTWDELIATENYIHEREESNSASSAPAGAPQAGAPQAGKLQVDISQGGAPQDGAPQDGAPQDGAPQGGAPQGGAPQGGPPMPQRLPRYLAHFPPYENGLVSLLEFIHSHRDKPTDPFPAYTSENAKKALETMKRVKEQASTDDDFASNEGALMGAMYSGNFLFLRYWYVGDKVFMNETLAEEMGIKLPQIKFTPLPGKVPGVSASCIGGDNISMSKHIAEERKKVAADILNFINSYEHQKLCISMGIKSGIHRTYQDPEVCAQIDCPLFSSLQGIVRPSSSQVNYEEYSETFRSKAEDFVFSRNNKTAKEILEEIDDIRKIHYIELNSLTSILILTFTLLTIILLFCAYIYVSIKRFRNQFIFLSFNYWCIFILGIFITLCYCFTGIYKLEDFNCYLRPILLSIGFSLIYIPIFLKMIAIFPSKNSISKFVKDHFTLCFFLFLLIDAGINVAWKLIDPLVVNKNIVTSGKNFQYCSTNSGIGKVFEYVLFGIKILILLIMSILVFAEWNLAAFRSDIRSVTSTIYTNLLLIVVFIVLLHINFKDRYMHFAFRAAVVIVFCLSTLVIIIGSKFYQISLRKENPYPDITSFKNSSMGNNGSSRFYQSNQSKNQSTNSNKMNLLSYHYQTGTPMKPNPTLFSATYNSSYNGNIFSNSSNSNNSMNNSKTGNESQTHSSGSHKHTRNYVNSNNNGYSFNNNNNSNNYNNSFTNNNYNRLY